MALPLAVVGKILAYEGTSLSTAVVRGDLAFVELLVTLDKTQCTTAVMDDAAARGHLPIVRFLHRASPAGCTMKAMDNAIRNGHLEVVKFLHFHRTEGCWELAAYSALSKGQVDVVRFLIHHRPEQIQEYMLKTAVCSNYQEIVVGILRLRPDTSKVQAKEHAMYSEKVSIETVKLLYELGTDTTPSRALVSAVTDKSDDAFMKYLVEQGEGFVVEAMGQAVRLGFVDRLKYLLDVAKPGYQPNDQSRWAAIAAINRRHAMVALLRERFPALVCSVDELERAARRGDAVMVKLLHRANRPHAAGVALRAAATRGYAQVVQHLAGDCDDASIRDAADIAMANGSFALTKYLVRVYLSKRAHGDTDRNDRPACEHQSHRGSKLTDLDHIEICRSCDRSIEHTTMLMDILHKTFKQGPIQRSERVMAQAARSGHLDVIKYVTEKNIGDLHHAVMGHSSVVRHLVKKNVRDLHLAVMGAISGGQLDVLRWLIESTNVATQNPVTRVNWMAEAARSGRLHVLNYLHENMAGLVCRPKAMDHAASLGHLDIVRFLHSHRTEGCTTKAMDGAAYGNHLEVVRFLHENRTEGCSKRAFEKSAERGLTEMVESLLTVAPAKCNVKKGIEVAAKRGFGETAAFLEGYLATQQSTTETTDAT